MGTDCPRRMLDNTRGHCTRPDLGKSTHSDVRTEPNPGMRCVGRLVPIVSFAGSYEFALRFDMYSDLHDPKGTDRKSMEKILRFGGSMREAVRKEKQQKT